MEATPSSLVQPDVINYMVIDPEKTKRARSHLIGGQVSWLRPAEA